MGVFSFLRGGDRSQKKKKGETSFIFHQMPHSWLSELSRARGPDNNITGSQLPRIRKTSSTREAKTPYQLTYCVASLQAQTATAGNIRALFGRNTGDQTQSSPN